MIFESNKTILLVEDMAIIAMAEASTLKKNGFDVIIAYNGIEAIKHASENPNLDLILMDIDLGKGMDGTEAAQTILKHREVPIVFLSSHTEKEIVEKTEKITSYGYVVKNTGETVLIASIKMAFKLFNALRNLKTSENHLRESDAKYLMLAQNIEDMIWTMDLNLNFTYVSPTTQRMYGWSDVEMMQLKLIDFLSLESIRIAQELLSSQLEKFYKYSDLESIVFELEQLRKDGTAFWTEIIAKILLDNNNVPVGIIGVTRDITYRKLTEVTLKKNQNKINSIFRAAPIGIGVTSNRILVELNDYIYRMLGYSFEELIGKSARILYPTEEEYEFVGREKYKQIEQFGTGTVETKWVCKDGRIIDVLLSSTPLNLKEISGGVTFTALDITGRKKSEDALRKSQERYTLAQRSSNIGSWEWNILTGEVGWSETIEPMFGFSKGEFEGTYEAYLKCIHPEDVGFMVERLNAAIYKTEEYKNLEMRIIWPNGTIRWMLANGTVYRDADDKPNRMIGIVQDITERKHAEEKLKQSEENYRRFFEEDLSGVFLSTPAGGIKVCNQAYVNMMEYNSIEELLKSNPVSHYLQSQQRIDFLNLLRKEKKLTNYEGGIVTKKGKHIQTLENILGVFDDKDNLVEFWGYVNDITDRKKAEQILINAAIEKEALHRELLHRVKNSFNLIKSLIYLEREKLDNKEASKILENLEMRIGTLSQMYSLLNISGISQQIDLGEYLNQITNSLAESFLKDADHIEIKTAFYKIITSPRTASSVGLIVNEVLTNSLKYAFPEDKKGTIEVILKKINEFAEIEITDDGIGVSENFSIEQSTGMGLQLVNILTQQLSGKVTVEVKHGTKFKVVFPLSQ